MKMSNAKKGVQYFTIILLFSGPNSSNLLAFHEFYNSYRNSYLFLYHYNYLFM